MRSILVLLLLAVPASSQELLGTIVQGGIEKPVYKTLTYEEGRALALKTGKPLMIYIGMMPKASTEYIVCSTSRLTGYPAKGAIFAYPKGDELIWAASYGPDGERIDPFVQPDRRDNKSAVADEWPARLPKPSGLVRYSPAKFTQSLSRVGSFSRDAWHIASVSRTNLEPKWQVPGGMVGIHGWKSTLYKLESIKPKNYGAYIPVFNGSNDQYEWGHKREYPDGALLADVLSYRGNVFEVRYAEKRDGEWHRYVAYTKASARPEGYIRPRSKDCRDCHAQAGTGGYATGLVPGGDTIISDPFPALEAD